MTYHFSSANAMIRYDTCGDTITLNNLSSDITEYYPIIRHYKKLRFREDFYHKGFNQPISLTKQLVWVCFAYRFNQYVLLTKNLTHIYFNFNFNTCIHLSKNLLHISFVNYNYPVKMTKKLTAFVLTSECDDTIVLGKNLIAFRITGSFNGQIVLPKNLNIFVTGYNFVQTICLPSRLKSIQIGSSCCTIIEARPKIIMFETSSNVPNNYHTIDNLPNGKCNSTIQINSMQVRPSDIIHFHTFSNHSKHNMPSDMKFTNGHARV